MDLQSKWLHEAMNPICLHIECKQSKFTTILLAKITYLKLKRATTGPGHCSQNVSSRILQKSTDHASVYLLVLRVFKLPNSQQVHHICMHMYMHMYKYMYMYMYIYLHVIRCHFVNTL